MLCAILGSRPPVCATAIAGAIAGANNDSANNDSAIAGAIAGANNDSATVANTARTTSQEWAYDAGALTQSAMHLARNLITTQIIPASPSSEFAITSLYLTATRFVGSGGTADLRSYLTTAKGDARTMGSGNQGKEFIRGPSMLPRTLPWLPSMLPRTGTGAGAAPRRKPDARKQSFGVGAKTKLVGAKAFTMNASADACPKAAAGDARDVKGSRSPSAAKKQKERVSHGESIGHAAKANAKAHAQHSVDCNDIDLATLKGLPPWFQDEALAQMNEQQRTRVKALLCAPMADVDVDDGDGDGECGGASNVQPKPWTENASADAMGDNAAGMRQPQPQPQPQPRSVTVGATCNSPQFAIAVDDIDVSTFTSLPTWYQQEVLATLSEQQQAYGAFALRYV